MGAPQPRHKKTSWIRGNADRVVVAAAFVALSVGTGSVVILAGETFGPLGAALIAAPLTLAGAVVTVAVYEATELFERRVAADVHRRSDAILRTPRT